MRTSIVLPAANALDTFALGARSTVNEVSLVFVTQLRIDTHFPCGSILAMADCSHGCFG
jgi:hypothetical protein